MRGRDGSHTWLQNGIDESEQVKRMDEQEDGEAKESELGLLSSASPSSRLVL